MRLSSRWRIAACLATMLGAWSGVASAGCTVATTGVAFGLYNPGSPAPSDVNGSLVVTCNRDSGFIQVFNYTASFSTGNSSSYVRHMLRSGGVQQLAYNIFNAGHVQVLGNGSAGTTTYSDSIVVWLFGPVDSNTHQLAGRIPPMQNAVPGTYLDNIVVTLTF